MAITKGFNHVATLTTDLDRLVEIQQLGGDRSLFFRDVDGMELEAVCSGEA